MYMTVNKNTRSNTDCIIFTLDQVLATCVQLISRSVGNQILHNTTEEEHVYLSI